MPNARAAAVHGWPYTLSPNDSGMLIEDVWPSIYFGLERVDEVRRKTEALPWARQAVAQMVREAEGVLATQPEQPVERVGWRHDFYSRRTAEHLVYDPSSSDRFLDPWSGEFEELPEQHRAWVLFTHERTLRLMRSLGMLYQLTGDERYAQWVAEGLRRAVEMFRHDELREGANTEALYFQPLYDAPVLMMLADAYEMTRDSSAYSDADHHQVLAGVFEKGMPYQIRFLDKIGVHNMSCFVAGALGKAGLLFGRDDWLKRGLSSGKNDLRDLLTDGVRAGDDGDVDGLWFEGTMFYHYYSLCPLVTLFELDKRYGGQSSQDADVKLRLERMFAAPVALADGRLRVPTVGDLGAPKVMKLSSYRHLYEYAAGQVDYEQFGPTLAAIYAKGYRRNCLTALAFGPDELPEPRYPCGASLLRRPGIGIMRAEDGSSLLFKAGPHGAGHDHADKLEIGITSRGRIVTADLGTGGYALADIYKFYRSTFSHNTLFVDEADQGQVSRAALVWEPSAPVPYACGVVEDAYEDVRLTRHVWFAPPFVALLDECSSEAEHRYGWLLHAYGAMHGRVTHEMPPVQMPPIEPLLEHLESPRTSFTDADLLATWRVDEELRLTLTATSDGVFETTLGRTPGNPMPDDRGTVVLRAAGTLRRFWALLELHSGSPDVAGVDVSQQGLQAILRDGQVRVFAVPG